MIGFRSFVKQFMQIRYTVIPISFLDVQFNYFNSAKYLAWHNLSHVYLTMMCLEV